MTFDIGLNLFPLEHEILAWLIILSILWNFTFFLIFAIAWRFYLCLKGSFFVFEEGYVFLFLVFISNLFCLTRNLLRLIASSFHMKKTGNTKDVSIAWETQNPVISTGLLFVFTLPHALNHVWEATNEKAGFEFPGLFLFLLLWDYQNSNYNKKNKTPARLDRPLFCIRRCDCLDLLKNCFSTGNISRKRPWRY